LSSYDLVVCGALNALESPGQVKLVRRILQSGVRTIVVALRLPYDLVAFPEAPTYICTYSILEPSMRALAKALFGHLVFKGKLPVSIPELHPAGQAQIPSGG
jgi:beta-N-acetylhexosaminidase